MDESWHDRDGKNYNCKYYGDNDVCASWGSEYSYGLGFIIFTYIFIKIFIEYTNNKETV